jgi:Phosphosulfolactate phosphohydrolase and related enzymes
MKINIYRQADCAKAQGICVIIDVLRAFTTAAFAFAAGAKEIILVSSIKEALKLHQEDHHLILMGELGGMRIEGFHYGNSPAEIQRANLTGRTVVQRTSAGTQGVIACSHASQMILSSFVVAEATLQYILVTLQRAIFFRVKDPAVRISLMAPYC